MLSANEQTALPCIFLHESSPAGEKKNTIEGIEKKIKSVRGKELSTFTTLFSSNKEQQPQMTSWLLSPPKFLAPVQRPGRSCRHPPHDAK